jgi:hypothetical protein
MPTSIKISYVGQGGLLDFCTYSPLSGSMCPIGISNVAVLLAAMRVGCAWSRLSTVMVPYPLSFLMMVTVELSS